MNDSHGLSDVLAIDGDLRQVLTGENEIIGTIVGIDLLLARHRVVGHVDDHVGEGGSLLTVGLYEYETLVGGIAFIDLKDRVVIDLKRTGRRSLDTDTNGTIRESKRVVFDPNGSAFLNLVDADAVMRQCTTGEVVVGDQSRPSSEH